LMATPKKAITSSESRRKLALVIGIGKYEHCEALQNSENDANDMSIALESIEFVVTKKLHPKRVEMKRAIVDFEESIEPGDIVLFYFAGHGTQWEDQNYLVPKDTPALHGEDLNR
ncbi:unnamed protein product, partial [Rotaria sordida]